MAKVAGGKNRKQGRNKAWCKNYANRQQRERNKSRRLAKHLKRFPDDAVAGSVLQALPKFNR